jgi:hypothetical protein
MDTAHYFECDLKNSTSSRSDIEAALLVGGFTAPRVGVEAEEVGAGRSRVLKVSSLLGPQVRPCHRS